MCLKEKNEENAKETVEGNLFKNQKRELESVKLNVCKLFKPALPNPPLQALTLLRTSADSPYEGPLLKCVIFLVTYVKTQKLNPQKKNPQSKANGVHSHTLKNSTRRAHRESSQWKAVRGQKKKKKRQIMTCANEPIRKDHLFLVTPSKDAARLTASYTKKSFFHFYFI